MILLQKIAEMFLLMAAGFVLFRKGLLGEQGTTDIGRLLTLAVIPVILINSLWADRTAEKTAVLVQSAVASALLMVLSVAAAVLIFPKDGVSCFGQLSPMRALSASPWCRVCWAATRPF